MPVDGGGDPAPGAQRRGTSTSAFGVSRRESHDATDFYRRFVAPTLSKDATVEPRKAIDRVVVGDARSMTAVPNDSVALVVTSPPYFAGKEYEEALGQGHIPATYGEYLDMLEAVFAECVRTLEPGGRIAVNVANLGRKPYRSLSADVIGILQDRLRLLLRGEVVWVKARGSAGSCAWGSFQRPGNPVLRDLSERVIVASKGRFDRALTARQRVERHLPSEASMSRDDFMEATTDLWEIQAESATRVGHPAPFPVELPKRLIDLYTYRGDLVLDPFMGSGTTGVAAVRSDRHYVGYETDPAYAAAAQERIDAARRDLATGAPTGPRVELPALPRAAIEGEVAGARAAREGKSAKEIAKHVLEAAGFTVVASDKVVGDGVQVSFVARSAGGDDWYFDVASVFGSARPGLRRAEVMWKALGKAAVLHERKADVPLVLLTTDRPPVGSAATSPLDAVTGEGKAVHAVIEVLSADGGARLAVLARDARHRP